MRYLVQSLFAVIVLFGSNTALHAQNISYATGALQSSPQDLQGVPTRPVGRNFLPEIVDLSDRMPAVGDQGQLGSCVSWAVGYAARSYYSGVEAQGRISRDAIPAMNYMHGILRVPDLSMGPCGGGAYIHQALALLTEEGAPSLANMPYSETRCDVPDAAFRQTVREGQSIRVDNYFHLGGPDLWSGRDAEMEIELIRNELAVGHPVVIRVDVDQAFFDMRGRQVWQAGGSQEGGHAITLVGYNDREQYFKFINSWGTSWGDRGYGRLSYDAYRVQEYTSPFTMRIAGVEPPRPPAPPGPGPVPFEDRLEIPELSCGSVELVRSGGARKLVGFVQDPEDMTALRVLVGRHDDLELDVDLRPWPMCEVLMTLRDPLKDTAQPIITVDRETFNQGDTLSFSVEMAPFEGFLHLAYVQADGSVVHLSQQDAAQLHTLQRGARLTFGDGLEGRPRFTVSAPFGNEMIIAIASAAPLFRAPRDVVEIERMFLTALREAILARPDPNSPARRVSASYFILETRSTDQKG